MAYPHPIPPLTRNESKEFLNRLDSFELTPEQERFWKTDTDNEPFVWSNGPRRKQ